VWQEAGDLLYLGPGWSHEVYSFNGVYFDVQAEKDDA
jgi:ribosomal protein L16 Arg81 hydroxylase